MDLDKIGPRAHPEMLPQADASRAGANSLDPQPAGDLRVKPVGGDDPATAEHLAVYPNARAVQGIDMRSPAAGNSGGGGMLDEYAVQRGAADADPATLGKGGFGDRTLPQKADAAKREVPRPIDFHSDFPQALQSRRASNLRRTPCRSEAGPCRRPTTSNPRRRAASAAARPAGPPPITTRSVSPDGCWRSPLQQDHLGTEPGTHRQQHAEAPRAWRSVRDHVLKHQKNGRRREIAVTAQTLP